MLSSSITFQFASEDYAYRRSLILYIKAIGSGTQTRYDYVQYAKFALAFSEAGYWKEAEELQVQVLQMSKKWLGEEHPGTLKSMGNLVSTYWAQGRWKEAEELGVQVLQMGKKHFAEEHPDRLTSMGNLTLTYWAQGQWKGVEELYVHVLQMRKQQLVEEHPDMLISIVNLSSMYQAQGRWKEGGSWRSKSCR
jgi:tetratricopeptide (TPR) repeat protein